MWSRWPVSRPNIRRWPAACWKCATKPWSPTRKGRCCGVLEFIGEPWDGVVLSYHAKTRSHEPFEASTEQAARPLTDASVGRWKKEMTRLDRAAFKAEAGELLQELGYAADQAW